MIRKLGMMLVVLLLAEAAALAQRPATQPDQDATSATQPEDAVVVRPAVTKVGVSVGPTRDGDVIVPVSEPNATGKGEPPPVISGEDLVIDILKSGGAASGAAGHVPTTDELSRSLQGDVRVEPSRPKMASDIKPLAEQPDKSVKLLPEGHLIRDRVGFVRRDRGRFVFVFEDNTGRDAPLTLLPNQQLESLLSQSHNASDKVRFRVTGTVTQYQKSNYLLLQMVLIEQNLDRF